MSFIIVLVFIELMEYLLCVKFEVVFWGLCCVEFSYGSNYRVGVVGGSWVFVLLIVIWELRI